MKRRGKDLIFISRINSDGSGTESLPEDHYNMDDEIFDMQRLSISKGTWIAANMSLFVVKLKHEYPEKAQKIVKDFAKVSLFPVQAATVSIDREISLLEGLKELLPINTHGTLSIAIRKLEILKHEIRQ